MPPGLSRHNGALEQRKMVGARQPRLPPCRRAYLSAAQSGAAPVMAGRSGICYVRRVAGARQRYAWREDGQTQQEARRVQLRGVWGRSSGQAWRRTCHRAASRPRQSLTARLGGMHVRAR